MSALDITENDLILDEVAGLDVSVKPAVGTGALDVSNDAAILNISNPEEA